MSKTIIIGDDSYKTFKAALLLTGEEEEVVLEKLINNYAVAAFEKIMAAKSAFNACSEESPVTKAPATNTPVLVCESLTVSAAEQKRQFVDWFKSLTRNGRPYNPVTISGYTGRIENACSSSVFGAVPVDNLFCITDLHVFLDLQAQIKACPGYTAFDAKSHNGFTAALKKYEDFLRFQANGGIRFTSVPHSFSPAPAVHRWTIEEDYICCKRFLECYVIRKSRMDTVQFLQSLSAEVPNVSEGSLRMKVQNIKYLTVRAGFKDTSTLKWLSQYSLQNERAFQQAVKDLNL